LWNWEQQRIILQTKRQASLEVVYDDNRLQYYAVDLANEQVKNFSKDTDFWSYLEATALALPKKGDVKRGMPLVNVTCDPSQPFGFVPSEDFIRDNHTKGNT
jgi:phage terminase Nu1 subunit (DNA packaging protein)